MKKFFTVIGIILVSALVLVYLYLNVIIKNIIEDRGSAAIGTKISLGFINFSPFSGKVSASSLKIASPQGFSSDYIFKLDSVNVEADFPTLTKDTVYIRQITIKNPDLFYELKGSQNNLDALRSRISSAPSQSTGSGRPAKKVIIDRVDIIGAKATLGADFMLAKKASINVPDIHLEGIGKKENGILIREAALQVLQSFMNRINFNQLQGLAKDAEKYAGEAVKKVEEQVDKKSKEVQEKLDENVNKQLDKFMSR